MLHVKLQPLKLFSCKKEQPKCSSTILVKTPIIVFPRPSLDGPAQRDSMTVYLGEIYASNEFVPLEDSAESITSNRLSAGVRNMRLTSLMNYKDQDKEELEVIDKADLHFDVLYAEHRKNYKRPDLEVRGSLSTINLRLTPQQLRFLLDLFTIAS